MKREIQTYLLALGGATRYRTIEEVVQPPPSLPGVEGVTAEVEAQALSGGAVLSETSFVPQRSETVVSPKEQMELQIKTLRDEAEAFRTGQWNVATNTTKLLTQAGHQMEAKELPDVDHVDRIPAEISPTLFCLAPQILRQINFSKVQEVFGSQLPMIPLGKRFGQPAEDKSNQNYLDGGETSDPFHLRDTLAFDRKERFAFGIVTKDIPKTPFNLDEALGIHWELRTAVWNTDLEAEWLERAETAEIDGLTHELALVYEILSSLDSGSSVIESVLQQLDRMAVLRYQVSCQKGDTNRLQESDTEFSRIIGSSEFLETLPIDSTIDILYALIAAREWLKNNQNYHTQSSLDYTDKRSRRLLITRLIKTVYASLKNRVEEVVPLFQPSVPASDHDNLHKSAVTSSSQEPSGTQESPALYAIPAKSWYPLVQPIMLDHQSQLEQMGLSHPLAYTLRYVQKGWQQWLREASAELGLGSFKSDGATARTELRILVSDYDVIKQLLKNVIQIEINPIKSVPLIDSDGHGLKLVELSLAPDTKPISMVPPVDLEKLARAKSLFQSGQFQTTDLLPTVELLQYPLFHNLIQLVSSENWSAFDLGLLNLHSQTLYRSLDQKKDLIQGMMTRVDIAPVLAQCIDYKTQLEAIITDSPNIVVGLASNDTLEVIDQITAQLTIWQNQTREGGKQLRAITSLLELLDMATVAGQAQPLLDHFRQQLPQKFPNFPPEAFLSAVALYRHLTQEWERRASLLEKHGEKSNLKSLAMRLEGQLRTLSQLVQTPKPELIREGVIPLLSAVEEFQQQLKQSLLSVQALNSPVQQLITQSGEQLEYGPVILDANRITNETRAYAVSSLFGMEWSAMPQTATVIHLMSDGSLKEEEQEYKPYGLVTREVNDLEKSGSGFSDAQVGARFLTELETIKDSIHFFNLEGKLSLQPGPEGSEAYKVFQALCQGFDDLPAPPQVFANFVNLLRDQVPEVVAGEGLPLLYAVYAFIAYLKVQYHLDFNELYPGQSAPINQFLQDLVFRDLNRRLSFVKPEQREALRLSLSNTTMAGTTHEVRRALDYLEIHRHRFLNTKPMTAEPGQEQVVKPKPRSIIPEHMMLWTDEVARILDENFPQFKARMYGKPSANGYIARVMTTAQSRYQKIRNNEYDPSIEKKYVFWLFTHQGSGKTTTFENQPRFLFPNIVVNISELLDWGIDGYKIGKSKGWHANDICSQWAEILGVPLEVAPYDPKNHTLNPLVKAFAEACTVLCVDNAQVLWGSGEDAFQVPGSAYNNIFRQLFQDSSYKVGVEDQSKGDQQVRTIGELDFGQMLIVALVAIEGPKLDQIRRDFNVPEGKHPIDIPEWYIRDKLFDQKSTEGRIDSVFYNPPITTQVIEEMWMPRENGKEPMLSPYKGLQKRMNVSIHKFFAPFGYKVDDIHFEMEPAARKALLPWLKKPRDEVDLRNFKFVFNKVEDWVCGSSGTNEVSAQLSWLRSRAADVHKAQKKKPIFYMMTYAEVQDIINVEFAKERRADSAQKAVNGFMQRVNSSR